MSTPRRGTRDLTTDLRQRAAERFHQIGWTVDARTGCHMWNGSTNGAPGYGQIAMGRHRILAHRVALELRLGRPIREGMLALHNCDRPLCVRGDHLVEGDARLNMRHRLERTGYFGATLTHCSRGHTYTAENTAVQVEPNGQTHRRCRECSRARSRRRTRSATAEAAYT